MTDYAALVARLLTSASSKDPDCFINDPCLMRSAADAIEQLTRTVAEQGTIIATQAQYVTAERMRADAATADAKKWQKEAYDLMHRLEVEQTDLAFATARLRTVEAETWEQASDIVRQFFSCEDAAHELHMRAVAARAARAGT